MSGHSKWHTIKHKKAAADAKRGRVFTKIIKEITVAARIGGGAVYVNALTDNRNRTLPEIRHLFSKFGGNLGESNCVSWMFEKKGYIVVPKAGASEDLLLEVVLEAGGEDVRDDGAHWEILSPPERLEHVREALAAKGIEITSAEVSMIPKN